MVREGWLWCGRGGYGEGGEAMRVVVLWWRRRGYGGEKRVLWGE